MNTIRLPVAVYGTLRPDCGNDRWTWQGYADARYDGDARIVGYRLVDAGAFPYLVADTDSTTVCALIYADRHYDDVLQTFDGLEGVPVHYQRVTAGVLIPDGTIVTAWTYVPVRDASNLPRVEGNDWCNKPSPWADRLWAGRYATAEEA